MVMRRMWHVWPGQLWPALSWQEVKFEERLRELAGTSSAFCRDDVSSVMGILRCGADLDASLDLAPGLNLPALLGAFESLQSTLASARGAWEAMVEDPSPGSLLAHADVASLLLPVPVHRALYALEEAPDALAHAMALLGDQVRQTVAAAQAIESELHAVIPPSPMGVEIGARLYSSTVPGAYADPFYCADRVTALSPVRVSDLLSRVEMLPV